MPRLRVWFECVGHAVRHHGLRALAGLMPFGEALYDIAVETLKRLRERQSLEEHRLALQEVAQAAIEEVKAEAAAVVQQVAADQPPSVQQALTSYLVQVPAAVRQSLKRPADPTGTTVPVGFCLQRPEQLLPLLPSRLPRFRPGDRPTPGGNWELVDLLGVGGFGEVWLARHPKFKGIAPVALKFCLDPSAAAVLRHEAELLDRVMLAASHPGIVPLRQAYLDGEPLCLEYEFVAGGDLAGLIREWQLKGPPPEHRTRLVHQLAAIVGHTHRLSPPIVHRDLKPANILVQKRGYDGDGYQLRVADFGIGGVAAGQALEQARRSATAQGDRFLTSLRGSHTPLYASPQQADGRPPDPRDDVHALGVIWYQMLTGDLGGCAGVDYADDLRELGVPEPWIELLGKCVAAKAERRPPDAASLADRIAEALIVRPAPEPIVVVPAKPIAPRPAELTVARFGPADYRSVADAVRAAPPGGRVVVRRGVYEGTVTLDKPVEIVGDGPLEDVVLEATAGNCLVMKTTDAVVRGLTLRCRAGAPGGKYFAVDVPGGRLRLEGCDVSSESLSCVAVHGASADPTLRDCRLHDAKECAVLVWDGGRALVENCDLYNTGLAGVATSRGGHPTLRGCKVHDSRGSGVFVQEDGRATVEDCDVYATAFAGVEVKQGGDPVLRRTRVHDTKQGGVYVHSGGQATVEDCDIFHTALAGVTATQGSDLTLRRCKVHGGKQGGVFVQEKSRATVESCDVYGNELSGVEVKGGSEAVVRGCTLRDSRKSAGLYVYESARATVQDCVIAGNQVTGITVSGGAAPTITNCKVRDSKAGAGVYIHTGARPVLEGCAIFDNHLSGVEVKQEAAPVLRRCKVYGGRQSGVFFYEGGRGTMEECEVYDNAFAGLTIATGADPVVRRCQIREGKQSGVFVYEGGRGTLEDCDVVENGSVGVEIKESGDPVLRNCRVRGNAYQGVWSHAGGRGAVERCDLTGNARGAVHVAADSQLRRVGNRE